MRIIAFGHASRVGKDVSGLIAYNWIKDKIPSAKVEKRSFALYLKQIAYNLFRSQGLQSPTFYENNPTLKTKILPRLGITPVQLWVKFGGQMRAIWEDIWVAHVIETCISEYLIITDLRFENEILYMKDFDPDQLLIQVSRREAPIYDTEADNALRGKQWYNNHIENNGTLQELAEKVHGVLENNL